MGQQFTALPDHIVEFIGRQKIFFVGTAAAAGRVNVSPQGMDWPTGILSPNLPPEGGSPK